MGKLKNILFMDVDNPNEKADGPIALRISAIVMMIYLAVISVETEKNGLIMHTDMDDLDFIENEYSGRVQNTLSSYSILLYSLLQENNWEQ